MRITSIPQIHRHVRRWTEILTVLSRYGLADWMSRTNVDFVKNLLKDRQGNALARHTTERRIRLALIELGPIFIKLGQLLSTRPDLVGVQLADELRQLQCDAPADDPDTVQRTIEAELGTPVAELFQEFEPTPLASASIGQVHRARLWSGQAVVVKVQHDKIELAVRRDLEMLSWLAVLAQRYPDLAAYRPRETVAELGRTLRRELDFSREARNLQQFSTMFAREPRVRIPRVFPELCTPRVLTMEYLDGASMEAVTAPDSGFDREELARRGAAMYLEMIFLHGFFHADPHPGNFVLLPENTIGLVDFGMVGRLDDRLREAIEELLMALVQRDVALLAATLRRIGKMPDDIDEPMFRVELAEFLGIHALKPIEELDLGAALNDMTDLIRRYHIILPTQVAMLIKTLVTLEGTARMLSPNFSLLEVMVPYHRKLLLRRLSPARQMRRMRRLYLDLERLAEMLPQRLIDILEQVKAGKFDVHLDHRGLSPSVNRLVLGMLASALFLGSSNLLSGKVPPLMTPIFGLEDISLLGLVGCTTSILIGLRLLRAIVKSGHLDPRDH